MPQPSTRLYRRLSQKATLSDAEMEAALIENHVDKPGFTEATYGQHRTAQGQTSYELLAAEIRQPRDAVVLDLACGNGPLSALIAQKYPEVGRLIGVDLCGPDLEKARQRVDHPSAEFRQEAAQEIGIASGEVDYVLSHLAFMLFQPIEPAVTEIARVLKPKGTFSAVISDMGDRPPIYDEAVKIMQEIIERNTSKNLRTFGWGDERTWTLEGLKSLFSTERGFDGQVEVEPYSLMIEMPAAQLPSHLLLFFYGTDLMPPEQQAELEQGWAACFQRHETNGSTRFPFPLTKITVRKA